MKKIQLVLLLLICAKATFAQLTLTGTIKGATHDSVELNVSYNGTYWKTNSVYVKPGATGNFQASFSYASAKFVLLIYKENKQLLLLSPGRPLHVNINPLNVEMFSFSGKAKAENDLLQKLKLEDERQLGFIKELKLKDSYANWSVDSVIAIKLPVIKQSLDSAQALVNKAIFPLALKKVIATELKYFYANAVAENIGSLLNNKKNRAAFNTHFIDTVLAHFAIPVKNELDVSINANIYLDKYFRFKLWKAVYLYYTDENKQHADSIFQNTTGVAYEDLENDPDRANEIYLFSTRLKKVMPPYAWEKHLTNLLVTLCMSGQLQSADKLLHFTRLYCTDPAYLTAGEKAFAPLRKAREQYADNLNIKIRPGYQNISSLKALLEPYKGKIVFVDMWGTWCPHCIEDMAFEPALKERLKGRDIVFLYVARDEDKDDEVWRDFIFINNLTGEHVRRTSNQIASLWNELGVVDNEQAYPYYFIFDRAGNLKEANAKRPGDGDALYNQLDLILNK